MLAQVAEPTQENNSLLARISAPPGYTRTPVPPASFAHYLRTLKLKPQGSKVKYYNGQPKPATGVYTAVLDADIGDKDLHQCADAIIRLKADYHYHAKEYDKIQFDFTNGHRVAYSEWCKGRRIKVNDAQTKTWWDNGNQLSTTYEDYWAYLEQIFLYAGTASLSKELNSVPIMEMKIGDVFIEGGFPGHGVIVIDMAKHADTGKKIYLLAQSYMPAQQTQILINPHNSQLSPWYELDNNSAILTPEYSFEISDLKRFPE